MDAYTGPNYLTAYPHCLWSNPMSHPFANVQYFRSSLDSDSLDSQEQKQLGRRTDNRHGVFPDSRLQHLYSTASVSELGTLGRNASLAGSSSDASFSPLHRKPTMTSSVDTQPSVMDTGQEMAAFSFGNASAGHFVKHSSNITLLLSGQDENVPDPVYSTGGSIVGLIAVARPSNLLSLEVKVSSAIQGLEFMSKVAAF